MAVYNGRLAERLGRIKDALQSYRLAADSPDRWASAQGRLSEIKLKTALGQLPHIDAIDNLETLTTIWRGDDTEIEALKLLAHLYTQDGRYRDAFHIMRIALTAHPNSDLTRGIQDEAAETFENIFLADRGDALSAIDALALFYDFRDLTPIGRRGDEMIRRLADRLVAVDLLDQAAELLQYQVDHRLQGAARAQVAMRLAVIYLMNHKPDDALATLRATRVEDVSKEMRQQRLLIESRALSDLGRYDVALEIIANIEGPEASRLRSDVLWAAHRWREAAEQIELIYGDRWKEFTPLNDVERSDILRAAAGYALGDDALGLGRFRERYAAKMGEGPDRRSFDVITEPVDSSGTDFRAAAHAVAAVDTLDGFLRDLRARYPETGGLPPNPTPPKPDPGPTGSIAPRPALSRTATR
jgi:tetratricopeptide (TPR) repeat protein